MSSLEAFLNHPIETLERALHIRKQIDQLNGVLKELFGPTPVSLAGVQVPAASVSGKRRGRPPKVKPEVAGVNGAEAVPVETKKGGMSAAGRAKIAAAQKKRWAKVKGESAVVEAPVKVATDAKRKKRKLSPEARARIVAAVKARWARAKGQSGK